MAKGKILYCFTNVNMGLGHLGLQALMEKHKHKLPALEAGEFIIFINRAHTRMKVYAANHIVAYLRLPKGRIDMAAIQYFPRAFNGTSVNYDEALKMRLDAVLKDSKPKREPVEVYHA